MIENYTIIDVPHQFYGTLQFPLTEIDLQSSYYRILIVMVKREGKYYKYLGSESCDRSGDNLLLLLKKYEGATHYFQYGLNDMEKMKQSLDEKASENTLLFNEFQKVNKF